MKGSSVLRRLAGSIGRRSIFLKTRLPRREAVSTGEAKPEREPAPGGEAWQDEDEDELLLRMLLDTGWMWYC